MPKIGIQLSEISKIQVLKSKWRLCASMMNIMNDKLNGCLLRYPVICFKGFFVKKFTIAFCTWCCFALSAMPAAEPAACIPAINVPQGILTL
ncbi:Uncharacterized protein APZ42_017504 [Daphnia magna]|uniref:Uncharacterized protein n=1 Tax=Daphnia magna TaxID=35525 RepID=A0A164ZWW0_9CRUS|nr:Uncharacterized protein APZ42_017504 [Daphnia magna]